MVDTKSALREVESQSAEIVDRVDFIRDNAGVKPFAGERATLRELLEVVSHSKGDFEDFAEWHVPIYIGRCVIEELQGHWSVEARKSIATFGQAYVDGFGNIDHENLYLSYLHLNDESDLRRIEGLWKQSRHAHGLRQRFQTEFGSLAGGSVSRKEVEARCVELGILPKSPMRFKVEKTRVTKYSKELGIQLTKG